MADEHGYFFDSEDGDRIYTADSFSEWLQKFFTTGVFQNDLQVTATSGMVVSVGSGYANINGKVRIFDTATTIPLAAANSSSPRIDTVVVELNNTDREITLKYVQGDYSGDSPAPKPPVRESGVYQIVLAQITVNAGATAITQADIKDTRPDKTLCGWVVGTVETIDLTQLLEQSTEAFEAWFDTIKGILGTDEAGRLQLEIEDLQSDVSDLQGATTIISSTMTVAGWNTSTKVYSFETDYPVASYDLEIELNGDTATEAQLEAWSGAMILGSALTNSVKAMGDVPTVALPIILKVTRKLV